MSALVDCDQEHELVLSDLIGLMPAMGSYRSRHILRCSKEQQPVYCESDRGTPHDEASGGFIAARPARLLITASSSAGSTGFAK
jgi:hypothetical protein